MTAHAGLLAERGAHASPAKRHRTHLLQSVPLRTHAHAVIGFGLKQGADSAVFTTLLVGLAVVMIGLNRRGTAPPPSTRKM